MCTRDRRADEPSGVMQLECKHKVKVFLFLRRQKSNTRKKNDFSVKKEAIDNRSVSNVDINWVCLPFGWRSPSPKCRIFCKIYGHRMSSALDHWLTQFFTLWETIASSTSRNLDDVMLLFLRLMWAVRMRSIWFRFMCNPSVTDEWMVGWYRNWYAEVL